MSIIVTVSDDCLPNIHNFAKTLTDEGMTINQILPITGVITGSLETKTLDEFRKNLEKTPGILGIEEESFAEVS